MGNTVIAVVLLLVIVVNCNADNSFWGNVTDACETLMPEEMDMDAREFYDDEYYRIVPDKVTFYPGQKVYIRIKGKTSDDRYTYERAILKIISTFPEGEWHEFHENKYQRISCGGIMNTGIIDSNDWPKIVGDDVFIWTAPDSCDLVVPFFELIGTVFKNDKEYLSNLGTILECVKTPEMPEEPIVTDACQEGYSVIPINSTSFEENYGGWWNDPMSELRWTRHTGPTPSPFTGPQNAIDGNWYIYSEASYPATEGDRAILNSPVGLAGCFCIRLKCHMFGGPGVEFYLMKNDELGFSHLKSADRWIKAYETVSFTGDVQIQMIMVRGKDFRGDIAIDDVTMTPGMCAEDKPNM